MKIREELSPARRRTLGAISVCVLLLAWFVLTLPMLPAPSVPPQPPEQPEAAATSSPETPAGNVEGSTATPPAGLPPTLRGGEAAAPAGQDAAGTPAADGSGAAAIPGGAEAGATTPAAPADENALNVYTKPQAVAATAPPGLRPIISAGVLPSPLAVLAAFGYLHTQEGLVRSAAMSFWRITLSFFFAALVAIPLGILMGAYPPVRAWIEPFSGPLRYLPISAVTGVFILSFGMGEQMKIAFLFTGTVVYLLPIVVECILNVDAVYLETAYTLGAKPWQVILRVLVPAALPGIFEACRVIYGIGWTYVILAEVINAEYGLGHLIQIAYKRGHIDWAYALVFVILLLGVGSNEAFRQAGKRLFVWRQA